MAIMRLTPTDAPIDLNAPMTANDSEYIRLWRNVIIAAMRESCDCAIAAKRNAGWTCTKDFRMVCALAAMDFTIVRKKLLEIAESEEKRQEAFEAMTNYKSKVSKDMKPVKYKKAKPKKKTWLWQKAE